LGRLNSYEQAIVRLLTFRTFFGEISSRLPLISFRKKAFKSFKNIFKPCFFILKYLEKFNNNRGLKRIIGLFAERSKWEVFSKGPRSKEFFDRLLLGVQIPQVLE
jgi:hypothetical protein